ncbi:galactosylgalactosylxylosylprotein 3-beta-glucuronosyltransferase 3-like [Lineus longissimus]|uniref:galactosylgalactosylxylosylprotein 3-beta-glucuronosyltransferase 3-like n=1 Tax=Lineus longissimus TaxID=88925 RepID=UPI002B4E4716
MPSMKFLFRYSRGGLYLIWIIPWLFWLSVIHQQNPQQNQEEVMFAGGLRNHRWKDEEKGYLDIPTIYVITPTYKRAHQKAELTRLAQTLLHIRKLHWIIVEDSKWKTQLVSRFLMISGLSYMHLHISTPRKFRRKKNLWQTPRGTEQRNLGIQWLRKNLQADDRGVVYFADDDNTYDIRLFDEMRDTNGVSCWPAGLHGKILYGGPICRDGKVIDFRAHWRRDRPFPMDMCSFAVNVKLLLESPEAKFDIEAEGGFQESSLLTKITTVDKLEPRAANCTKILVWHTRTESPSLKDEEKLQEELKLKYNNTLKIPEV